MNWTTIIITTVVSALVSGFATELLYRRNRRRSNQFLNDWLEHDPWEERQ